MRLISLWEPWSTLLATGQKKIETRGWNDPYRGEVAIHSTKGGLTIRDLFDTCAEEPFLSVLKHEVKILQAGMSPRQVHAAFKRGCIIAVGEIVDILPTEAVICIPGVFDDWPELDTPQERAFGDFHPGRYGLVFENVRMLKEPVPFKSRQGKLLELDIEIERQVREL